MFDSGLGAVCAVLKFISFDSSSSGGGELETRSAGFGKSKWNNEKLRVMFHLLSEIARNPEPVRGKKKPERIFYINRELCVSSVNRERD